MKTLIYIVIAITIIGNVKAQTIENTAIIADSTSVKTKIIEQVAKDTTWDKGANLGLNISQTSFSNWAAGGQNSVSGTGIVSLFANKHKNKATWDNTLDLAYGLVQQGTNPVVKSDDKIDLSSKYGQHAFKKWYYSGLLNFRTQFAPGYADPIAVNKTTISDFLAPAYLIGALGMDYKHNKYFSIFASPFTGKTTFVLNQQLADAGAFGVEVNNGIGENIRNEFGAYFKAAYKKDIMTNVNLGTKLDLFSNYLNNPENIDISWEVLISMKVNKYITTSISAQVLYDDDIHVDTNQDGKTEGPRTQFKQVIAVGFAYKL